MYCVWCGKDSTFDRFFGRNYYQSWSTASLVGLIISGEAPLLLKCQRNNDHHYKFSILILSNSIQKIGQYPSMESISSSEIAKYRNILEKQDFAELHRAGGLASHGIGIAPYVYLRRIFERLIYQHYENYKKEHGEIQGFEALRIDDKISNLSEYLPATLVKHKSVYKILSKGIHELDEESCKKYYPVVRAVVIAILEEDLQRKEKEKAAIALQAALNKALTELGNES